MTIDDHNKLPLLRAAAIKQLGGEFRNHPALEKWSRQMVPLLDRHSWREVCRQLVDQVKADVESERD